MVVVTLGDIHMMLNDMPRTFIILPQVQPRKSSFINRAWTSMNNLFWEKSMLYFICPVTLQRMGKGKEICIPSKVTTQ